MPTYSYNAENQLTSTAGVTYEYDGDGKSVSKSTGTLYWHGGGSDPIAETDGSGNTINEYIFFGGKRIARVDSAGDAVYYMADHLGTSRVISDPTGTILDDSDFYPFGAERPAIAPTSGNTYKFTGKERDFESGNDDFAARYFASSVGRFMSADPSGLQYADLMNPQSLNLYSYVLNNPIANIDPAGLSCVTDNDGNVIDDGDGLGCIAVGPGSDLNSPGDSTQVNSPLNPVDVYNGWVSEDNLFGYPVDNGSTTVVCNSVTDICISAANNKPAMGTAKTPAQCAIYLDGSATGTALYTLCSKVFPNGPVSNQIRGCLQSQYNSGHGYLPVPVIIPAPSGTTNLDDVIPGTGAHLACFANGAGLL